MRYYPRKRGRQFALIVTVFLLSLCHGSMARSAPSNNNVNSKAQILTSSNSTSLSVNSSITEKDARQSPRKKTKTSTSLDTTTRRILHEYKSAVKQGIVVDWTKNAKPVNWQGPQYIWIGPLGGNKFIWHFSFTGISTFEKGIYHGRIILPSNYPAQPPRIQVWTPSGRFVPFTDICLMTASNYHPEAWTPGAWTVRTIVESLRLHMLTNANEIGGMNDSYENRIEQAIQSQSWSCAVGKYRISHAEMIKQGLFGDLLPVIETSKDDEKVDVDDTFESSEFDLQLSRVLPTLQRPSTIGAVLQLRSEREQAGSILYTSWLAVKKTLSSPIRLAIGVFIVLFCYLNQS